MMMILKPIAVIGTLFALSSCASSFDRLQAKDIENDDFPSALAMEYREFAESEAEQYDWLDAFHFSRKGLSALNGETVLPEDPVEWKITDADALEVLQLSREQLIEITKAGTDKRQPTRLARAYMLYDCWVEQVADGLDEPNQQDDIQACSLEFTDILKELRLGDTPNAAHGTTLFDTPRPSYTVTFRNGSAALDDTAIRQIKHIASVLEQDESPHLMIHGYADRAGSPGYNAMMARQRAFAVRDAFINIGLSEDMLTVTSHGEENALVATEDGVHKRENRRVTILIERNGNGE